MKITRCATYTRQEVFHADNTDELFVRIETPDHVIEEALQQPNPQLYINLNGHCPPYQPTKRQKEIWEANARDIEADYEVIKMNGKLGNAGANIVSGFVSRKRMR